LGANGKGTADTFGLQRAKGNRTKTVLGRMNDQLGGGQPLEAPTGKQPKRGGGESKGPYLKKRQKLNRLGGPRSSKETPLGKQAKIRSKTLATKKGGLGSSLKVKPPFEVKSKPQRPTRCGGK